MVRGRTVDESLPLTRSLTIQREYRARKAAKIVGSPSSSPTVSDPKITIVVSENLEESNARLSTENAALKAEIADLKCRVRDPSALTHSQLAVVEMARGEVQTALSRLYEVQQMALAANGGVASRPPSQPRLSSVDSSSMPAPSTPMFRSNNSSRPPSLTQAPSPSISAGSDVSFMASSDNSITSFMSSMPSTSAPAPPAVPMFDPSCCGGLFDCSTLPMSGMRSAPPFQTPRRSSHYAPPSLQNGTMLPMATPQTELSES